MKHKKCYPCLRTHVTLVPGPYNGGGSVGVTESFVYQAILLFMNPEQIQKKEKRHTINYVVWRQWPPTLLSLESRQDSCQTPIIVR